MKSRTSFFDLTVFRKNVTRFAPIWSVFLIYLLIQLMSVVSNVSYFENEIANTLAIYLQGNSVISFVYALACGLFLFGDLYSTKLCNALHALPQRRETWFCTNVISGLAFFLVPSLLVSLIYMPLLGGLWYISALWLLGNTLEFLFFFGLAVICAMVSGNRIGMIGCYLLTNFLSVIAYVLFNVLYEPLFVGPVVYIESFQPFCPVIWASDSGRYGIGELLRFQFDGHVRDGEYLGGYIYQGMGDNWWYLWVIAGIGLVLMGLAVLLYRKRHLETAGDLLSFRCLWPVFTVIVSLGSACLFFLIGRYILLLPGLFLGYMGCQMLLQRKVNVFKGKAFLGFGILTGALLLSFALTLLDPIGITRWTPDAEDVKSVFLTKDYTYREYYGDSDGLVITDPEQIQALIEVHEDLIDERHRRDEGSYIFISYKMADGRTIDRHYRYSDAGKAGQGLRPFFNSPEYIMGYNDWDAYLSSVDSVVDPQGKKLGNEEAVEVLEAMRKDIEEGNMSPSDKYYTVAFIDVDYINGNSQYFDIYSTCRHTIAWLHERYPDEY